MDVVTVDIIDVNRAALQRLNLGKKRFSDNGAFFEIIYVLRQKGQCLGLGSFKMLITISKSSLFPSVARYCKYNLNLLYIVGAKNMSPVQFFVKNWI